MFAGNLVGLRRSSAVCSLGRRTCLLVATALGLGTAAVPANATPYLQWPDMTTIVSGSGSPPVEGGLASTSTVRAVDLAVTPAGDPLVLADTRLWRVDTGGRLRLVAGNGSTTVSGDGGSATAAGLGNPIAIAVEAGGSILVATNRLVRRITVGGTIQAVAGVATGGSSADGVSALSASLNIVDVASHRQGGFLVAADGKVRRVTSAGIVTTMMNDTSGSFTPPDGSPWSALRLESPMSLAMLTSGDTAVMSGTRIWRVGLDGTVRHLAGRGSDIGYYGTDGDDARATQVLSDSTVAAGVDDTIVVPSRSAGLRRIEADRTWTTLYAGIRQGSRVAAELPDGRIIASAWLFSQDTRSFAPRAERFVAPERAKLVPDGKVLYLESDGLPSCGGQLVKSVDGTTGLPGPSYGEINACSYGTNSYSLDPQRARLIFKFSSWLGMRDLGESAWSHYGEDGNPQVCSTAPAWSPDGERLACEIQSFILVYEAGRAGHLMFRDQLGNYPGFNSSQASIRQLRWHPDGETLTVLARTGATTVCPDGSPPGEGIFRLRLDPRAVQTILPPSCERWVDHIDQRPDGRIVLRGRDRVAVEQASRIWILGPADTELEDSGWRQGAGFISSGPLWSADGRYLQAMIDSRKIAVIDPAGGATRILASTERPAQDPQPAIVELDGADPIVTIASPANGTTLALGSAVVADYSCDDGVSGIATCTGTAPDGSAIDTSVPGIFTFTVTATDHAGNTTTRTATYTVADMSAPSISIAAPQDGDSVPRGAERLADYACADEAGGSGLASCAGSVPDGSPINTSSIGERAFSVTATDAAGNTRARTVTYTVVDDEPPSITIVSPAPGAVYAQGQPIPVTASCVDEDGGSGEATIGGDDEADSGSLGTHTIIVTCTDGAGNTSTETITYTVTDQAQPAPVTPNVAEATYGRNELVIADYSCEDEPGGSGLASCVGDVPDGAPVDTSTLGRHPFTVIATDHAGNVRTLTVYYTIVDRDDPAVDVRAPVNGASYQRGAAVEADYACVDEDGGSGVATCVGTVADGEPIDTATLGEKSFSVTATDEAGNTASRSVRYTIVDVTDPTVAITTPENGASYTRGATVEADFACADDAGGSGVESCVGTAADGEAIDTTTLGAKSFDVTATDEAGNAATRSVSYTVVDDTDPTVTIVSPAAGASFAQGQSVVAAYSCADEGGGSGLASCVGDVGHGEPIDTQTGGSHTFEVRATDHAGNSLLASVAYTVVDVSAPSILISSPAAVASVPRGQVVAAHYACVDEPGGSGVATCAGTVADGQLVDTSTLGLHTFTVATTDHAGNPRSSSVTYTVVDVTPPVIAVITPGEGTHYVQGASIAANYGCSDEAGGSALATCAGTVPNGQPIDTSASGAHVFTVSASDNANNTASSTVHYTADDRTPPSILISRPTGTYTVGQNVTAAYACTDNAGGSGMASCTGSIPSGQSINTGLGALGTHTFTVTSRDQAGNSSTQTLTYRVALVCVPIVGLCL